MILLGAVRGELYGFGLLYSEDRNSPRCTNKPGPCKVLRLPPALSVECIFIDAIFFLTVILNSLNLPFQGAQSKDIFPHLCIVSEFSGVHF